MFGGYAAQRNVDSEALTVHVLRKAICETHHRFGKGGMLLTCVSGWTDSPSNCTHTRASQTAYRFSKYYLDAHISNMLAHDKK